MATNNANNSSKPIGVSKGGTGVSSLTAYAPLCGGTTSTGVLQQATTSIGTSGSILTSQGASALPAWVPYSAAITKIATLTASSSASLAFTSSQITSSYNSYLIIIENVGGGSVNAGTVSMTFSTNNGSTYLATGYQSAWLSSSALSGVTLTNTNSTTQANVGGLFITTGHTMSGALYINLPQTSGIASYVGRFFMSFASATNVTCFGNNSGTTAINNIKFAFGTGNILQGTITLYGISQ